MSSKLNFFQNQQQLPNLDKYDSGQELLAVATEDGTSHLVKIAKKDLTIWQVFLKFLGFGKFAHVDYNLKNVAIYLNKYDWKEGIDQTSDCHKTYLKVCEIANKALLSRKETSLYKKVSQESRRILVELSYGSSLATAELEMHWNPKLQVKHLLGLATQSCRYGATISCKNDKDHILDKDIAITKEDFTALKINIAVLYHYNNFPNGAFV